MFEVRAQRQRRRGRGDCAQVGAEQRAEHRRRRTRAEPFADQQGDVETLALDMRQFRAMLEHRRAAPFRIRQRDPKLHGVAAPAAVVRRFLRVADAVASGHHVDLARAEPLPVAEAVAVQQLALDHPGEGLQADVRMRADLQAAAGRVCVGPGMVEEAPGANHAPLARGQHAPHRHAADVGDARVDALERRAGRVFGHARSPAVPRQLMPARSRCALRR